MVATKAPALDKQRALRTINNFLDHFKNCCNQKNSPSEHEFSNIICNEFQNYSSGKLIGRNLQDFLKRIQDVQKKYSHIEFVRLQDCLVSDNKAIIQYDLNLISRSGEKSQLNIMAIATFDGDLITHWSQVSHDKFKHH